MSKQGAGNAPSHAASAHGTVCRWAISGVKEKLGISGDEQDAAILEVAQKVQQVEVLTGYLMERSGPVKLESIPVGSRSFPPWAFRARLCGPKPRAGPSLTRSTRSLRQCSRSPSRALSIDAVPRPLAVCAAAALLVEIHRSGWPSVAPGAYFVARKKTQPGLESARQLMDSGRHAVPLRRPLLGGRIGELTAAIDTTTR